MNDPTEGRKNAEEPELGEEESHDDEAESSNPGGVNLADLRKEEEPEEEEVLRLGRDPKPLRGHRLTRDLREAREARRRLLGIGGAAEEAVLRASELGEDLRREEQRYREILGVGRSAAEESVRRISEAAERVRRDEKLLLEMTGGAAVESVRSALAATEAAQRDVEWRDRLYGPLLELEERERLFLEAGEVVRQHEEISRMAGQAARDVAPWLSRLTLNPAPAPMDFHDAVRRREDRRDEWMETQTRLSRKFVEVQEDTRKDVAVLTTAVVAVKGEVAGHRGDAKDSSGIQRWILFVAVVGVLTTLVVARLWG